MNSDKVKNLKYSSPTFISLGSLAAITRGLGGQYCDAVAGAGDMANGQQTTMQCGTFGTPP